MNTNQKVAYKIRLKQICAEIIAKRIQAVRTAIDDAQEAANSEEKSSAGDKYETSRALSHLDRDMYARQLEENQRELSILHSIDVNTIHISGKAGAFLKCSRVSFFIAAGLGKHAVDSDTICFLSPYAPLAKLLNEKNVGDVVLFNKTEQVILEIF